MVPDVILNNPRKQGINAPVTSFVDFTDPELKETLLADSPFFDYVDRDRFAAFLGSDIARNSDSKFLFSLLAARLFVDHHSQLRE